MPTVNKPKIQPACYRPDIDGLRAIAVVGVVLYHAGLGLPGGFAGVDVFFVISGYLITRLILRELQNGDFSILTFLERRIRRILPALSVVVISTLFAGWFLSLPFHYLIVGQSTVALMALSSNIQFWRSTNYFAPQAEDNPLLHTWSLSVEEQFYLIVPFLLLLVFRLRREHFVPTVLIVGSFISFLFAVFYLRHDPSGAFFLLPSRAWELGVGCILATLPLVKSHSFRTVIGYIGIALVFFTFFFYDPGDSFPGTRAAPPVFGAAFIILAGCKGSVGSRLPTISRLLGSKLLVFVGLCSYSFYLWHWPFFAFHRYIFSKPPTVSTAIVYITASFVISIVSLYLVERPFRVHKSKSKRSHVFAIGGLVILLIFICSMSIYTTGGVPNRLPPEVAELSSASGEEYMKKEKIFQIPGGIELRVIGQTDLDPTLLVWGDSHALASLPAIDNTFKKLGRCAVAAIKSGTAPVVNWGSWKNPSKQMEFNRSVFEYAKVAKDDGLTHVLLIFYWSVYIQEQKTPIGFNRPPNGFSDALIETIYELQRAGLKVVIFMETPIFPVHVPKSIALHKWHGTPPPILTYAENQLYRAVYDPIIDRIRMIGPDTKLFDPQALFLGEGNQLDFLETNGQLLFKDKDHLSKRGALRLEPALIRIFSDKDSDQQSQKLRQNKVVVGNWLLALNRHDSLLSNH